MCKNFPSSRIIFSMYLKLMIKNILSQPSLRFILCNIMIDVRNSISKRDGYNKNHMLRANYLCDYVVNYLYCITLVINLKYYFIHVINIMFTNYIPDAILKNFYWSGFLYTNIKYFYH